MPYINLKIYYPESFDEETIIEASNEIIQFFEREGKNEDNYERRIRYNNAAGSLENDEFIFLHTLHPLLPLEDEMELQMEREELYAALRTIPQKQSRRVYAYYILGLSMSEIARMENVGESSISKSLSAARKKLKRILLDLI